MSLARLSLSVGVNKPTGLALVSRCACEVGLPVEVVETSSDFSDSSSFAVCEGAAAVPVVEKKGGAS